MNKPGPRFVTTIDLKTHTTTTIPAKELAPGMIQVSFNGREGVFWAKAADVLNTVKPSPPKHPSFDDKTKGDLRKIIGLLGEVHPISIEEFENGLRRDQNPDIEIGLWLHLASVYESLNQDFCLDLEKKKELFQALLQCSLSPYEQSVNVVESESLSPDLIRELIGRYYGKPALTGVGSMTVAQGPLPDGITQLSFEAIESDIRLLKDAKVVMGLDSSTGEESLFYGKDFLEEIVREKQTMVVKTASILFDSRLGQLKPLIAIVIKAKGSCCHPTASPGMEEK